MDGLVEQFNQTLKNMIRKFMHEDDRNWGKWLKPLLFVVQKVRQALTGFFPFELHVLCGCKPCSALDIIREIWEDGPLESKCEIQYILGLRAKRHREINPGSFATGARSLIPAV